MNHYNRREMNERRVRWARTIIDAFSEMTSGDQGEESLRDLLTDLRHWSDTSHINWEESLATAMQSYLDEADER